MARPDLKTSARFLKSQLRNRTTTVASFDGVGIAYEDWGTAGGRGPVVLNHGFAVDSRVNWYAPGIVDRLTKAGYRVIGIDARGHGRSDKPHDVAAYGEDAMARDVVAVLDELGFERVDLVGYSMGAVVSALVAATDNRVEALVLGGVGRSLVDTGTLATGPMSNEDIAEALLSEDPAVTSQPEVASFRMLADFIKADRTALAAVARSARSGPLPLDRITARTLVLAGSDDSLADGAEVLAEAIPDARAVTVPGDHLGAVAQGAFIETMLEFLDEDG